MTGLQEAFYIIGIVYMAISLLLVLGVVIAVFVIRTKVVSLEKLIQEKLDFAMSLSARAGDVIEGVKKLTKHTSR